MSKNFALACLQHYFTFSPRQARAKFFDATFEIFFNKNCFQGSSSDPQQISSLRLLSTSQSRISTHRAIKSMVFFFCLKSNLPMSRCLPDLDHKVVTERPERIYRWSESPNQEWPLSTKSQGPININHSFRFELLVVLEQSLTKTTFPIVLVHTECFFSND